MGQSGADANEHRPLTLETAPPGRAREAIASRYSEYMTVLRPINPTRRASRGFFAARDADVGSVRRVGVLQADRGLR